MKAKPLEELTENYRHIAHGLEPVFDTHSRIVVLGSFPSILSREFHFYYGNPKNRFWRIMAFVLNSTISPDGLVDSPVEEKKLLLLENHVALWDVIESCDIIGSNDASIRNVKPVPIERIMSGSSIETVIVNGNTAGRLYHQYLEECTNIPAITLPSTSPANASWSLERLTSRWHAEFSVHLLR
jgi:hypoxanthine-DNA glycosylase